LQKKDHFLVRNCKFSYQIFPKAHKTISTCQLSILDLVVSQKKQQRAFCQKKLLKGNAYFCALQHAFGASTRIEQKTIS